MRWLWLLPIAALVVHYVIGRYNTAAVRRDWDLVLTPAGQRLMNSLQLQTQMDAAVADDARERVGRERRRANYAEALRVAELGAAALIAATPSRLQRLRAMAICARMLSAVAPVEPLRPRDFRLRQVATLAGLGMLVNSVLLTTAERFVLKLQVLSLGFRLVLRALGHSTADARKAPTARAFDTFERASGDWKTLDEEHVEAFRAILVSLSAEPRGFCGPPR